MKELVENSLDAGATSIGKSSPQKYVETLTNSWFFQISDLKITVSMPSRFRTMVVESRQRISILLVSLLTCLTCSCLLITCAALKHYTSKLSTYDDLNSLHTFGFRGEALSSLCALSDFHIVTARDVDAPKGTRLEFELSGKLRGKSIVASQKGTTVVVEKLFKNLPVRRKELEKNIKREYGKVLGILQAYACVSVGIRLSVSNQAPKG